MSTREIYAEMGFDPGVVEDPYGLFAELRRETPVRAGDVMIECGAPSFLAPDDSRAMFTLLRYDDIAGALRDAVTFSSKFWEEPGPRGQSSAVTMDGDEHHSWRTMLTPVFGRKALGMWEEQVIMPVAQRCVEELAAAGDHADLVDFAHRFPMLMTYEIIGLHADGPGAFERFQELTLTLLLGILVNPDAEQAAHNAALARQAAHQLHEWVVGTVERRRSDGASGTDLISHVIRAERESGKLDDQQIALFVRTIASGATENTTRQFLNTMTCLLERPELLSAVRDDDTLLALALTEAERYETPALTVPRLATQEIEMRGTVIPAGAFVLLVIGSANRDPDAFPDPDTFDIDRSGPPPLTFGLGRHRCPGINLARAEITAATKALLDQLPNLRLDPASQPPRIAGTPFRRPPTLRVIWGDV